MHIETLKIFCDIIRRNSFSKGAAENNITQSMASQTINKLEKHFQITLIDRSRRPWNITTEGTICYEHSKALLENYYKMEKRLHHLHHENASTTRIATIYSAGLVHMRPLLEKLKNENPEAKTQVDYFHPDEVYSAVSHDEADIGIVSFARFSHRDLTFIPWCEEEMVVAVAPEHPFAHKKNILPSELTDESHISFDPDLEISKAIRKFFKKNNTPIKTNMHFDNVESIKRAVEIGPGFATLPLPCLKREVASGSLVALHLDKTPFSRPLYIIHRKGKELLSGTQQLLSLMQEICTSI